MIIKGFLVVRSDGSVRATKRRVPLSLDEVAFPYTITIPPTWGAVQAAHINLTMPDPPAPTVEVAKP